MLKKLIAVTTLLSFLNTSFANSCGNTEYENIHRDISNLRKGIQHSLQTERKAKSGLEDERDLNRTVAYVSTGLVIVSGVAMGVAAAPGALAESMFTLEAISAAEGMAISTYGVAATGSILGSAVEVARLRKLDDGEFKEELRKKRFSYELSTPYLSNSSPEEASTKVRQFVLNNMKYQIELEHLGRQFNCDEIEISLGWRCQNELAKKLLVQEVIIENYIRQDEQVRDLLNSIESICQSGSVNLADNYDAIYNSSTNNKLEGFSELLELTKLIFTIHQ